MTITDIAIRNAKPREKQYKLSDEKGLYVLIRKSGKYFRFDYRYAGKRKILAIGVYPDVTLAVAGKKRDDVRALLQDGIDPSQQKKENKIRLREQAVNNFEAVAQEWFKKTRHIWTEKHATTIIRRLELNVFPWLGKRPVKSITPPELLDVLRKIENRGAIETAHRVKQICGQVFKYAIVTGRGERDPSADLKGALSPSQPKHMPTITDPSMIGGLLRAIDGYNGLPTAKCALQLAPQPNPCPPGRWSFILPWVCRLPRTSHHGVMVERVPP